MSDELLDLFERNRRWAAETEAARAGLLHQAAAAAGAAVPVDRLRRQPRAGQRDPRPAAGRRVRAPQRRQRGRALRPQRAVGDAVRDRHAAGAAHHRRRPLRLRRRDGGAAQPRASASPTTGCATCRTCATSTATWLAACPTTSAAPERAVRAERARAGAQRLRDHRGAGRLGARPERSSCTAGSTACTTACSRTCSMTVAERRRGRGRPTALRSARVKQRFDADPRGQRAHDRRLDVSATPDRRARLRHRAGDARRLQPPLPAVPRHQREGQAALRARRLARPAARAARAHRVLRQARRARPPSGCSASSRPIACRPTSGSRSSCTTSAC